MRRTVFDDVSLLGAVIGAEDDSQHALFDTRLTAAVRLASAAELEDFVSVVRAERRPPLHRAAVEAMTVRETSFFRDAQVFDALRETILPELIRHRAGERRLRIWSAACSTGQEAYSVAMMMCEHFPELTEWDVKVMGTDVSENVIEYARRGRYRRPEVNRGLPARMLLRYLTRDEDEWEMSARVRGMCEFREGNLCAELDGLPMFDLVLLRNVLFYLSQQERSKAFEQVRRQMAGDGYLVLGGAEQAEDSTSLFEVEFAAGCCVYRPVMDHFAA